MSESVIFEIQVDQKVLEQVFKENQHLKQSYDKLISAQDAVLPYKSEIASLKNEIANLKDLAKKLSEENVDLKTTIQHLGTTIRINEEKEKSSSLAQNENRMLKMKLEKCENDKTNLIIKFEKEKKILEELFKDNTTLRIKEQVLNDTKTQLHQITEDLKKSLKSISKLETKNQELDKNNLNLEQKLKQVEKKLRLEEERNKCSELEHVESKLLKLKLQNTEYEKKYLTEEFQRERKVIMKQNQPRVAKLEENLKHLRKWIEKQAEERHPHDSEEVKMLKEKIHTLETAQTDLIEGFELERKVFQKIVKANGNIKHSFS